MEKYVLVGTDNLVFTDKVLYRIKALIDFADIKAGDLGGYIEKEENLSHKGNCWVYDSARVFDNARVSGDAQIRGKAIVRDKASVYGNAIIRGAAVVSDHAKVYDNAQVYDLARVNDYAEIYANAQVYEYSAIYGYSRIYDNANIHGTCNCHIDGFTWIFGDSDITAQMRINGDARISNAVIHNKADYLYITGIGADNGSISFFRDTDGDLLVNCNNFTINYESFIGTIGQLESLITELHGNNKFAREYSYIINLARLHFEV